MRNVEVCRREIKNNKREISSNIISIILRMIIPTLIGFTYGLLFWKAFASALVFLGLGGVISINKIQECMNLFEENKMLEFEIKKIKRLTRENEIARSNNITSRQNQTQTSVSQMGSSVSQTKSSAFQERNNTNNTKIIKNITYENTISSPYSPSTTSTNGGSGDCGFATIQVSNNKVDELVGRLNKGKTYESSDVFINRYF